MKINKFLFSGLLLITTTAMGAPWQVGISAYDTNGEPYSGKAYINGIMWYEDDFENGIPVRILADACMQEICEKKETIKGTPYIRSRSENGKPLNGMIKKTYKKEKNQTQLGQEGLYTNGVPDGLHKEFNEKGLTKEVMYDKGKTLWEKKYGNITPMFGSPYEFLESDMQETLYDGGVITNKYYKNNTKILERKMLFDGRLIEISLYENNKIIMRQEFNADGTSQAENFVNNSKKNLDKNKFYNLRKSFDVWEEEKPYDYKPFDGIFYVIAGKHVVCSGIVGEPNQVQCLKYKNSSPFNTVELSDEQKKLFHKNPSEFFAKNEPRLDLSDFGEQDVKQLNANLEKQIKESMERMKASMQGAMEGMAEGMLSAESEDEFKEIIQKRIDESVSTGIK